MFQELPTDHSANKSKKREYVFLIEVMMISRLYLSSSLAVSNSDAKIASGVLRGAQEAKAAADRGLAEVKLAGQPGPVGRGSAGASEKEISAAQRQLTIVSDRLAQLVEQTSSNGLGFGAQSTVALDANVSLSRAVAFGFRSVGFSPPPVKQ